MRLYNPTGRKTEARVFQFGEHTIYFSYETPIAYAGPNGRARVENVWGVTTGRHMNELGVKDFPVVDDLTPFLPT